MDPYIGEIRIFAGSFAPQDWAFCNGTLLPIQQNTALFSILGTVYGGNGTTTFGLPNLQGQVPMGTGTGPGMTPRDIGDTGGSASYTLDNSTLPSHTHSLNATSIGGNASAAANNYLGGSSSRSAKYGSGGSLKSTDNLDLQSIGLVGGAAPVSNLQPYLALNFIICLAGIWPQRE